MYERTVMDFSEINSPSDLIEANEAAAAASDNIDTLLKPIYDQDPDVALDCARDLLINLITLHQDVIEIQEGENNTEGVRLWSVDLGRLVAAAQILKDVRI